jgi:hypothetical protein
MIQVCRMVFLVEPVKYLVRGSSEGYPCLVYVPVCRRFHVGLITMTKERSGSTDIAAVCPSCHG